MAVPFCTCQGFGCVGFGGLVATGQGSIKQPLRLDQACLNLIAFGIQFCHQWGQAGFKVGIFFNCGLKRFFSQENSRFCRFDGICQLLLVGLKLLHGTVIFSPTEMVVNDLFNSTTLRAYQLGPL